MAHSMTKLVLTMTVLALGCATHAFAAECDPNGIDAAAIAAARVDVAANCDCAGAPSHGGYVRCASSVLEGRIDNGQLNASCEPLILRCASRSACGKPGAVACCQTTARGTTSCHIKRDAGRCRAPRGGTACVGSFSSCCDACTSTGCAPVATASLVTPTPTASGAATPAATPTDCVGCASGIRTVFLILMENHNWSDVKGSRSAPYINGTLLSAGSHAEQYYNPPGIHPSEPNYLWLEAGTNFGILNDAAPSTNHQRTTAHLVTLLGNMGIAWTSYQEGISGTACPLTKTGLYAPKHNPMVFFDDVTNRNDPQSVTCIAHVRPYSELAGDLQNGTVARYNFITPNLCNDMHDSCAPVNDAIKQGDDWLAAEVPKILESSAYANDGALLITWDEGEGGFDGPIGMIVLSPRAKGGGYANTIHYTHGSTLRTVEEIFGVAPLLGDAATATDLSDLFASFP
jgi:hypothetical protein